MNDEDKQYRNLERAHHAQRLKEDELLNEAFDYLRENFLSQWESSPVRDVMLREKLWMMISGVRLLKKYLDKVLDDGKLAQADLKMRSEQVR